MKDEIKYTISELKEKLTEDSLINQLREYNINADKEANYIDDQFSLVYSSLMNLLEKLYLV